jgi:hypothetical protein
VADFNASLLHEMQYRNCLVFLSVIQVNGKLLPFGGKKVIIFTMNSF